MLKLNMFLLGKHALSGIGNSRVSFVLFTVLHHLVAIQKHPFLLLTQNKFNLPSVIFLLHKTYESYLQEFH